MKGADFKPYRPKFFIYPPNKNRKTTSTVSSFLQPNLIA